MKETAESTYNVPMTIPPQMCRQMIISRAFVGEEMTFPLNMNSITAFNMFSHGSITFTGDNINCVGEPLRMANGKVNKNMLRSLHYLIGIHDTQLTAVDGDVLHPSAQTVIADDLSDHGFYKTSVFIWDRLNKERCDLLRVSTIEFFSVNDIEWFSDVHKIQLTAKDTFHHPKCNLMVTTTDLKGVFVADPNQDTKGIHEINFENINPNTNYISQLSYLNAKLSGSLQAAFSADTHPACKSISKTPTSTTIWVKGSTFLRNMGDCSLVFKCLPIMVVPIENNTACFTRLQVQDIKGRISHLDPNTRILMDYAAPSPCHPSMLPIYRNDQGDMVIYSPNRELVKYKNSESEDNIPSESGLYSPSMVTKWFSLSFLQHFAKHSYSIMYDSLCGNECTMDQMSPDTINMVQSQLNKIKTLSIPTSWFGFDLDYIGNRCSIVVVLIMAINILHTLIATILKCCIFQKEDIKPFSVITRALCSDLFLITNFMRDHPKTDSNEKDNDKV